MMLSLAAELLLSFRSAGLADNYAFGYTTEQYMPESDL